MAKRIPGAPASETPSAKQQREVELGKCEAELKALLDRYDATLSGSMIMQLAADGSPRYTFRVLVTGR